MAEVKDAFLECASCHKQERVRDYDPSRAYRCPDCSGVLMTPSQGGKTLVRPLAEEAIPPEVQKALQDPANRLGRFVLVQRAGGGGMGVVYKAWDQGLGRWVAVKIVRAECEAEDLARFKREAKVSARLDHPHIAPIHEVGEESGKCFIVMKYVDGATLDRAGLRNARQVIEALRQACQGVAYAHENGVIHRDIKPKNIMLDRSGRAFVMDFGLAKALALPGVTCSEAQLGTPNYMSPEQAQGQSRTVDGRADVYSLGATLWQMLAGRPPHEGSSIMELILRVATMPVAPIRSVRPDVPEMLSAVLGKAMARDKEDRYKSATELDDALRECLKREGQILEALPLAVARSDASPADSSPAMGGAMCTPRWRAVLGIGFLLGLIGLAAFFALRERAPQNQPAPPVVTERAVPPRKEESLQKVEPLPKPELPPKADPPPPDPAAERRRREEDQFRAAMDEAREAKRKKVWKDVAVAAEKALAVRPAELEAKALAGEAAIGVALDVCRDLMTERKWRSAIEALSPLLRRDPPVPEAAALASKCLLKGTRIAFVSERDGDAEIYSMNADGTGLTRLTRDPAHDDSPVWSPDGKKLAFVSNRSGNQDIYIVGVDGAGLKRLTDDPQADFDPAWSPDGREIAYQHQTGPETSDIWIVNVESGTSEKLTRTQGMNGTPAWSPDGKRIAFYSTRDRNQEIYIMNRDGTGQTRLTQTARVEQDNMEPRWSPDGKRIAFQRRVEPTNYEIFVIRSDGSGESQLTVNPALDGPPVWSQDGKKIAFYSSRDRNLEIYLMNSLDGSGQTRLTRTAGDSSSPCWSPDGKKIVFTAKGKGSRRICVIDADGNNLMELTRDQALDFNPVWSDYHDE